MAFEGFQLFPGCRVPNTQAVIVLVEAAAYQLLSVRRKSD